MAAFGDVFDRRFQEVVGFAALVTGNVAAAEDAAQEAFMRALARWEHVGTLPQPEAWIKRTAANYAVDMHRRRRREASLSPDVVADVQDLVGRLWAEWELAQLRPIERAMAVLRYEYGHDTATVASLVGRSGHTVRSYLQRLRRRGMADGN